MYKNKTMMVVVAVVVVVGAKGAVSVVVIEHIMRNRLM
jgi:hypothetical protein